MSDRFQIVVQLIDQRYARGDVQLDNLFVRDIVQVLHQRSQAVTMGGDDHLPAGSPRVYPQWLSAPRAAAASLGRPAAGARPSYGMREGCPGRLTWRRLVPA